MSFMKSRSYSVIYMFVLSALFAGLLSLVKVVTADQVRDNERLAASKNLVTVFELMPITPKTSGAELASIIEKQVKTFWAVEGAQGLELTEQEPATGANAVLKLYAAVDESGKPLAFAFPIGGKGFWGPIEGLMSVQTDGVTIRTVVWTKHGETPGLGARIEEPQYREKFRSKQIADPTVTKFKVVPEGTAGDDPHKIDQITGATQTTVVGMGHFLNDNFALWLKVLPLLQKRYPTEPTAVPTEPQTQMDNHGEE